MGLMVQRGDGYDATTRSGEGRYLRRELAWGAAVPRPHRVPATLAQRLHHGMCRIERGEAEGKCFYSELAKLLLKLLR